MNAETLHHLSAQLRDELARSEVVARLEQLHTALTNSVGAPQEPAYQQQISEVLGGLQSILAEAPSNRFSAYERELLGEMGIGELLGNGLLVTLEEIFARNQITQAVARDEVRSYSQEPAS